MIIKHYDIIGISVYSGQFQSRRGTFEPFLEDQKLRNQFWNVRDRRTLSHTLLLPPPSSFLPLPLTHTNTNTLSLSVSFSLMTLYPKGDLSPPCGHRIICPDIDTCPKSGSPVWSLILLLTLITKSNFTK